MRNFLIVFLIFVLVITLIVSIFIFNNRPLVFCPERWENNPEQRWRMRGDLIYRYEIVGMSRDEIIELLDTTRSWQNLGRLEYSIGGNIFPMVFTIIFDEDDIAYQYLVWND